MPLPPQRHLFDLPEDVTFLNAAALTPLAKSVVEAGEKGLRVKAQPWKLNIQEKFSDEPELARSLFAKLIGGDADGVAIVSAVSSGISLAASQVSCSRGQRILVMQQEFPSNVYPWQALAERTGAEVIQVPRPSDFDWTSAILEAIDPRTAVVAVGNCHWMDGSRVDLAAIRRRTREVGAALVVDAVQSIGVTPTSVAEFEPDFLVAGTYKWLLGPYSLAFLYAHPSRRNGMPLDLGWANRVGADDHTKLSDYRQEFMAGARRYDVGERGNYILLPMAIEAFRLLLGWGVENIAATLLALTTRLREQAEDAGVRIVPASRSIGHMTGLRFKEGQVPAALLNELTRRQIHVSLRGDCLRVAPHVYNSIEDLDRLMSVVRSYS